jgi:penicillin-insensitive murein endopeptidase
MSIQKKLSLSLLVMTLGLGLGYCARSNHIPDPPTAATAADAARRPAPAPILDAILPVNPDPEDELERIERDFFRPVTFQEPWFPFLDDDDPRASVSVGTVSNGHLVNAAALPLPGLSWRVLPRQHERGLVYGTQELISLLQYGADALYQKHQTPLWLGNIGRRGGGDIPWSVSHNSGRDADLAFCYTDPQGRPVDPPDLVQLDKDGRSVQYDGFYRLDVPRTWTLVRALLTWKGGQLQYIFISNPLRQKLLKYAADRREPLALQQRAAEVLAQPGGALPHDDHLHVRLFCSAAELAAGCQNLGAVPPELQHSDQVQRRLRQIAGRLKDPDDEQRARAIERLALARAWSYAPAIADALEDPHPRPRAAAAIALRTIGSPDHVKALAARFSRETDPVVMAEILKTLGERGGQRAGELLARVIVDPSYDQALVGALPEEIAAAYQPWAPAPLPQQEPVTAEMAPVSAPNPRGVLLDLSGRSLHVRLVAIEVAALTERPEPVPALIEVLREGDPLLRDRAARALERLTNHRADLLWAQPDLDRDAIERGVEVWRQWWARFAKKSRDAWLIAGFQARQFQIDRLDHRALWELARATLGQEHLSYNAQRLLMRLTEHAPQSLDWPKNDACWHWTRWLKKNRRQLRISDPPPTLAPCDR